MHILYFTNQFPNDNDISLGVFNWDRITEIIKKGHKVSVVSIVEKNLFQSIHKTTPKKITKENRSIYYLCRKKMG